MNRWLKKAESDLELSADLQEWFAHYRHSLPDVEPGASFMPGLWNKIEARRRSSSDWLYRLARQFVTAAFAMCLGLSAMLVLPMKSTSLSPHTYVEMLDEAHSVADDIDLADGDGAGVDL